MFEAHCSSVRSTSSSLLSSRASWCCFTRQLGRHQVLLKLQLGGWSGFCFGQLLWFFQGQMTRWLVSGAIPCDVTSVAHGLLPPRLPATPSLGSTACLFLGFCLSIHVCQPQIRVAQAAPMLPSPHCNCLTVSSQLSVLDRLLKCERGLGLRHCRLPASVTSKRF